MTIRLHHTLRLAESPFHLLADRATFGNAGEESMIDTIEAALRIRIGAERLRKIAASEADAELIAEMIRMAQEMDEHSAELERSVRNEHPILGRK